MKLRAFLFPFVFLVLIGCSEDFPSHYRFTVEEVNIGEASRYVFESELGPSESSTFDLEGDIKVEVTRGRVFGQETMEVVLFDYVDSELVSIGAGKIDTARFCLFDSQYRFPPACAG